MTGRQRRTVAVAEGSHIRSPANRRRRGVTSWCMGCPRPFPPALPPSLSPTLSRAGTCALDATNGTLKAQQQVAGCKLKEH